MEEEREEKIPHMCESIGHQPLQGTGTADHLTILRLFTSAEKNHLGWGVVIRIMVTVGENL